MVVYDEPETPRGRWGGGGGVSIRLFEESRNKCEGLQVGRFPHKAAERSGSENEARDESGGVITPPFVFRQTEKSFENKGRRTRGEDNQAGWMGRNHRGSGEVQDFRLLTRVWRNPSKKKEVCDNYIKKSVYNSLPGF